MMIRGSVGGLSLDSSLRERLGGRVNQLSQQVIQLCYHCHKCTAGCPAAFAMEYGPDRILRLIQLGQWERVLASRDIWLCLGCEMCGVHCPNEVDVGAVMIALRRLAAEHGYWQEDCERLREVVEVDERLCIGIQRLNRLSQAVAASHNVSGDDNSTRLIWSQNLEHVPPGLADKPGAQVVYFVGCVGAFFPRSYRVPQAMTRIMGAAGVDFTTLGGEEWCCGYPLLALGQIEQAKAFARHNIARVEALGAARLVSTCPSCYHMWKSVYPEILGDEATSLAGIEVLHATELLMELIAQGAIELGRLELRVTYHDPCDLGRKGHIYELPRRVLRSIPGLYFVEMSSHGQISECCGGGGNLESFDPDVVSEVSLRRVERAYEALASCGVGRASSLERHQEEERTRKSVIVSACQQCERTLTAAVRHHEGARRLRMQVMDVTELVWRAMQQGASPLSLEGRG